MSWTSFEHLFFSRFPHKFASCEMVFFQVTEPTRCSIRTESSSAYSDVLYYVELTVQSVFVALQRYFDGEEVFLSTSVMIRKLSAYSWSK